MDKQIKPFINIGPGEIIKLEMKELNWTQKDLAEMRIHIILRHT